MARVVMLHMLLNLFFFIPATAAQQLEPAPQPLRPVLTSGNEDRQLFKSGADHYRNEDWLAAIADFEQLVRKYPDSPLASQCGFYLGEALMQARRHTDAASVFQQVIDTDKDATVIKQSQFRLAECQFASGDLDKAREGFGTFVDEYRDDSLIEYAMPWLAELEYETGNYEQAERHYKEIITRFFHSPQIHKYRIGLAQSLEQLGRKQEADRYFQHVAGQKESDLADDALLLSARMWLREGDHATVEERIASLFLEQPDSPIRDEADYLLARTRMARDDWDGAWKAIEQRLDHVWSSRLASDAAADIARIALRTGHHDEARQKLEELERLDGKTDKLLSLEIELASHQGDFTRTGELLSEMEHSYPDSPYLGASYETVARHEYQSGDCESASGHYRRVLELYQSPRNPDQLPALTKKISSVRYRYALSLIDCKRYEEAVAVLPPFSDMDADVDLEGPVSLALAVCLIETGKPEDAIPHFQRYLKLKPDGPEHVRCRADLARSFAMVGRLDEAESTLGGVINSYEANPSVMRACETIAEVSLARNDLETAREFFEFMARSTNPAIATRGANGVLLAGGARIAGEHPLKPMLEKPRADNTLAALMDEANRSYSELDFPHAIELYENVLQHGPDSEHATPARLRMAICLLRNGNPADRPAAMELLRTVVDSGNSDSSVELGLYELGWLEQQDNLLASARNRFQTIVERFPESGLWADALYRQASIARKMGDLQEATALFTRLCSAKSEDPLVPFALQTMGEICADRGEWDQAIALFEKVQQTAGETALMTPALYWAAECRYQKGLFNVAERQFELLSRMELEDRQMAASVALRLAQCHMRKDDWVALRDTLAAAEKRAPGLTTGYQFDFLRGRMAMAEGKFAKARTELQGVLVSSDAKGTETAAMAQWMIGETFLHEGMFEVALHAYQAVEQEHLWPEWQSLAVLQSAKCFAGLGRQGLAESAIKRLMNEWPDSTAAVDARLLLSQLRRATALQNGQPAGSLQPMLR
jgi:cellulose synthase operon protein C